MFTPGSGRGDGIPSLRRLLLVPFMRGWAAYRKADRTQWAPRPRDATTVTTVGPDPDRVLIFGSGGAVGWGVLTNELALPGALGRELTRRTGRGTIVELVADTSITAGNAVPLMNAIDISRFDAIVLVLGANDAARLTELAKWKHRIQNVVDHLSENSPTPTLTFLTGIPPWAPIPRFGRVGRVVAAHARHMNNITARICDSRLDSTFVPLAGAEPSHAFKLRDRQSYRIVADTIADVFAPRLDDARSQTGA